MNIRKFVKKLMFWKQKKEYKPIIRIIMSSDWFFSSKASHETCIERVLILLWIDPKRNKPYEFSTHLELINKENYDLSKIGQSYYYFHGHYRPILEEESNHIPNSVIEDFKERLEKVKYNPKFFFESKKDKEE